MINKYILTGVMLILLASCHQTNKPHEIPFDQKAQIYSTNFNNSIFSRNRINSKEILDTLSILADTIFVDTAEYVRTPVATVFANNAARTYFQVFEHPKGIINAIAFFKTGNQMNVAEYFANGQIMCKFKVTDEGIRDGHFFCFYENGTYRKTGYYKNGSEIDDSAKTYTQDQLKNEESIYRSWTNGFIALEIATNQITIQYHGQCYYFYPLNTINPTTVELVWDENMDCKFDNKTGNDFGLKNVPKKGAPFARYRLVDTALIADYYFPEWVKKYSDEVSDLVFTEQYFSIKN